ncbi:hypothetical protein AAG906_015567 [Vitis piasezkii]
MDKALQHAVSSLWTPSISFRHDAGASNILIPDFKEPNERQKENGESFILCCSNEVRGYETPQHPKTNITHKEEESEEYNDDDGDGTWQPSMEGFLKYLVDSKLIFNTVDRIIDDSQDVSYAYFRRTGLERSGGLSKDLEWFSQQNMVIPPPSNPGVSYAQYLEEIAEKSAPLFLCHFYNIYFSHIAGGQVIARRVSEKLLEGRELEFYKWEGDVQELFKGVREKLNMLGEHWTRDEKNKCLRETTKSFRFMGQIVRLIIS